MRKEQSEWEYKREESAFNDYRSRFYSGKWEKAWIKEVASYAFDNKIDLYEAMWRKSDDKIEHMPKRLFKFFPFNHNSLKCLETNSVFMNNPKNFNDPFDSLVCSEEKEFLKRTLIDHFENTNAVERGVLTEEELDNLKSCYCEEKKYISIYETFDSVVGRLRYDSSKHEMRIGEMEIWEVLKNAGDKYETALRNLRQDIVCISSFAEIDKFQLNTYMEMWAHYAQNHEGFCVEYDMNAELKDRKVLNMVKGGLLPCEYRNKQVVIGLKKMYKYVNRIPFNRREKIEFDRILLLSFLTKSSSWSYENEWRLILPLDICGIYGNMIPFYPIKSIYVGCRMPMDNVEYIYRFAERKGIDVYHMDMHEYKYELDDGYSGIDIEKYFMDKESRTQKQLMESKYSFWKH